MLLPSVSAASASAWLADAPPSSDGRDRLLVNMAQYPRTVQPSSSHTGTSIVIQRCYIRIRAPLPRTHC